ncbi:hypothetical protein M3Y95_00062900 [Aphelenchoides besseyi]|nr:hypothetical protein M3Y95_00062900 [Aphelenchoides besseyi]
MKAKFNSELFANAAGAPQVLRYRSARLPSKVTSEEATMCLRTLVDVLDNPDIAPINANQRWPCKFCEYDFIHRADWCEHLTTVHNVPDIENHLFMGTNSKKSAQRERQRRKAMTPMERAAYRKKDAQRGRQRRKAMTPLELKAHRKKRAEASRRYRQKKK